VLIVEHIKTDRTLVLGESETERNEGFTVVNPDFGGGALYSSRALE